MWERDYLLDDSNIMAFIRKLRKKIEPNPDAPRYILTIWHRLQVQRQAGAINPYQIAKKIAKVLAM